jgi:hypothetical protein
MYLVNISFFFFFFFERRIRVDKEGIEWIEGMERNGKNGE